ncbi:MAG: Ankyrin repeat (many copies) [Rickettsiales bacterium]|jgi:hypothetical protein|nr:Ankyrin repeat (many copies) [Rickettsiales bacterium]
MSKDTVINNYLTGQKLEDFKYLFLMREISNQIQRMHSTNQEEVADASSLLRGALTMLNAELTTMHTRLTPVLSNDPIMSTIQKIAGQIITFRNFLIYIFPRANAETKTDILTGALNCAQATFDLLKLGKEALRCAEEETPLPSPVHLRELDIQFLDTVREGSNIDSMKRLLQAGANINARDEEGLSALDHASLAGNSKAIKFLLVEGAKLRSPVKLASELRTAKNSDDIDTALGLQLAVGGLLAADDETQFILTNKISEEELPTITTIEKLLKIFDEVRDENGMSIGRLFQDRIKTWEQEQRNIEYKTNHSVAKIISRAAAAQDLNSGGLENALTLVSEHLAPRDRDTVLCTAPEYPAQPLEKKFSTRVARNKLGERLETTSQSFVEKINAELEAHQTQEAQQPGR